MKHSIRVNCYLFTVLVILDQITKLLFWPRDFFLGPLHIHPIPNFGLVFSLDFGGLPNMIIIAVALILFCYYFYQNHFGQSRSGRMIFILIAAGGVGNLIDRLYLGYVRDFIDMRLGFTFNLADVMVLVGLILILISENRTNQLS